MKRVNHVLLTMQGREQQKVIVLSSNTAFRSSAGDLEQVKKSLEEKVYVNAVMNEHYTGHTALTVACLN